MHWPGESFSDVIMRVVKLEAGRLGRVPRYAAAAARLRQVKEPAKPSPAKPTSVMAQVEGSGTVDGVRRKPADEPM